jgi:hypothetical protein
MHFLQRSTYFPKTCCRPFAAGFRRIVEQAVLTSELPFRGWESPEIAWARFGLDGGCSSGILPISVSASIANFQWRNADAPLRLLRHPKKGSFKTTVTPFSRSGWSVIGSASLAKGGTWKRDRHRTSTMFRLGLIRWVDELCKRPSYLAFIRIIGKSEGKKPYARPTRRYEDNIKVDLIGTVHEHVDLIHLARDRD